MGLLEKAREKFAKVCRQRGVDLAAQVQVRPLTPKEAIGEKANPDFAIKRGKEVVIEATFGDARGQAFTDCPSHWTGTLADLMSLDLANIQNRAVFVAGLNAIMRSLGMATGTVHCRDADPERCGPKMADLIEQRYGKARVGLIGLQPAILRALVERFGPGSIRVLDLNPENIGRIRSQMLVENGAKDLPDLVEWCDVGLATGSTVVNASMDEIVLRFEKARKPLIFFGNTISGAAALLGLERLCPFCQ